MTHLLVEQPLVGVLLIMLLLAAILWPRRGLLWRSRQVRQQAQRTLTEDVLKHVHRYEMIGRRPTVESVAGVLNITVNQAADILTNMQARDLLWIEGGGFRLTPGGRDYALQVIRAHRLWERYLADETGFVETEWHAMAERREHTLSPTEADTLAAQLGHPTHDSHGDPIPTASGEYVSHGGQPLTAMSLDEPARIVHIEDEPQAVYAQLVAEGLHVGATVRITEMSPQRVRLWADGDEHLLAPIVAENISVVPQPEVAAAEETPGSRLIDLKPGEKGKVLSISRASRGSERRRLMDLGILPDTVIKAEMTSPSGDPTAYRIRGALIGLREEQAKLIHITRLEEVAA